MSLINTFILVIIALSGYFLFYMLNIPSPLMLGPIFMLFLMSKFGLKPEPLPTTIVFLIQVLLGMFIGVIVTKEIFIKLRSFLYSSLLMIIWTLFMTFGLGSILILFFNVDIATAFLSTAPAGVSEAGLLAVMVGADAGVVSLFQLTRFIVTLALMPFIVKHNSSNKIPAQHKSMTWKFIERYNIIWEAVKESFANIKIIKPSSGFITATAFGLIGGILGVTFRIPGGALIGSIFGVSIGSLLGFHVKAPPETLRFFMQLGVGITIGINIANENRYSFSSLLFPIFIFTIIIFSTSFMNAHILKRLNGWDTITCILAAAPAGISPMSILAYNHTDSPLEVSLLHMARLVTVQMLILPAIVFFA